MSGPPPPGYYPGQHPPPPGNYPPPGQHPPPPPGYYPQPGQQSPPPGQYGPPQGGMPPPYAHTGGYYPPPYTGAPTPAQGAYPPVAPGAFPGQQPPPGYGPPGFHPPPHPGGHPFPHAGVHPGPAHAGAFPPHSGPHHGPIPPHSGHGHGPSPPHSGHGHGHGQHHVDAESDDSDPSEFALYSREDKHPLTVKFTNKTGKRVQLFWINKRGRRKRRGKLKDGQSKSIDTYETHVFMAVNKKVSREPLLINGSPVFYAFPHQHGDKHVNVEIRKPSTAHSVDKLKSDAHVSVPVEVKFVNRTRREVQLDWITPNGRREKKKVLPKGRCWRTTSWEGHYWVSCDPKHHDHMFVLNFGRHYRAQKSRRARERVVITADMNISGSSSSSSD